MLTKSLEGQTALVTGAARGIGLAAAQHLARRGCRLVLWDLDFLGWSEETAGFGPALTAQVDVSSAEQVDAAAQNLLGRFGGLQILVNNAGINGPVAPVAELTLESWNRVLAVDLTGVFLCSRAFVKPMCDQGYGRIINVSSIAGKEGTPNVAAYCAAKAGVIGFTKTLAREVVTRGVTVNAIAPVMAQTHIQRQMTAEHIEAAKAKIPMGRLCTVEEIAATIGWIASPECSFTTGFVFDVSGGRADY